MTTPIACALGLCVRPGTFRKLRKAAAFLLPLLCAAAGAKPPHFPVPPSERAHIRATVPNKPLCVPKKPRRLLIFDRNVGYPGHPSASRADIAFVEMGRNTGAFTAVLSDDPEIFRPGRLCAFSAVLFNNTVGNLFEDPGLRRSLISFVYAGGGLAGIHGTTVAFTRWPGAHEDWPEFGVMLGARGARHRQSNEQVVVKVEDPDHPLTTVFGASHFTYRDEFFRVSDPYSRRRVRVLLSIDTERTSLKPGPRWPRPERRDNDYALSWIRNWGRGRVFYCTVGHNPYVFWDPLMLRFYLGALQFVLGDLPAPTTPSAFLTPEVKAQEKLTWRLLFSPASSPSLTVFEAAEKASGAGFLYLEATAGQKLSKEVPRPFDCRLTEEEGKALRLKLDRESVRLLSLRFASPPEEREELKHQLAFARAMGVEVITAQMEGERSNALRKLSENFGLCCAREVSLSQIDRLGHDEAPIVLQLGNAPFRPGQDAFRRVARALAAVRKHRITPQYFSLPAAGLSQKELSWWVSFFGKQALRLAGTK